MAKKKPVRRVKLGDLKPGPIRNELTAAQLGDIKDIWSVVGPCQDGTLEQFEIGFMRDRNPDREILIWRRIAETLVILQKSDESDQPLSAKEAKKLLGVIIAISTGMRDRLSLGVTAGAFDKLIAAWDRACDKW